MEEEKLVRADGGAENREKDGQNGTDGRAERGESTPFKRTYEEKASHAEKLSAIFFRFSDCARRLRPLGADRSAYALAEISALQERLGHPATIDDIARFTGLASANVCRILKPLEQRGLTMRIKRGRTVSILVTAEGHEKLDAHKKQFEKYIAKALEALGEEEKDGLVACGEKLLKKLERAETADFAETAAPEKKR